MRAKDWLRARMDTLWHPRRVAMIGATNSMGKWGFIILARMLNEGFHGEIIPVNPREATVMGRKAYPDVAAVPGPVDLAVIVTPSPTVPGVLRQCIARNIPAAVVITSNFSEVGAEGRGLEDEVVGLARDAGMILVGPNTMGIYSAQPGFNCLMASVAPMPGTVACIAQSGNVGTHMLFQGRQRGLGFGKFVSSGNEGDTTFDEYLWYFGQDDETTAVVGYLEGLDEGSSFFEVAAEVTTKKPVIIYKGGRTRAGGAAAASHTGALAGDMAVMRGAFRQAGVILAESNKEVIDLARALQLQQVPAGPRVGILTRGGGWGVITADACAEAGLSVAPLSHATIHGIGKILPPYWSHGNPVDMVAVLDNQAYLDCLDLLVRDPGIDAVIALGANVESQGNSVISALKKIGVMTEAQATEVEAQRRADSDAFLRRFAAYLQEVDKPVLTVGRWTESLDRDNGLMMISEPEEAARMMAKMVEYGRYLGRRGLKGFAGAR